MEIVNESTNLNIRIDKELKNKAENLFSDLGLNMTTAINIYLKQCINYNGIPFEITNQKPSKELLKALKEADKLEKKSNSKTYKTMNELISALDK